MPPALPAIEITLGHVEAKMPFTGSAERALKLYPARSAMLGALSCSMYAMGARYFQYIYHTLLYTHGRELLRKQKDGVA
jgi:hypothetical protein